MRSTLTGAFFFAYPSAAPARALEQSVSQIGVTAHLETPRRQPGQHRDRRRHRHRVWTGFDLGHPD
jgi:hypothetical protein